MTIDEAIHERWDQMTEGGKLDDRVQVTERLFEELRTKLRERYNTPADVLDELDTVRGKAVAAVKRDIVLSSHWSTGRWPR